MDPMRKKQDREVADFPVLFPLDIETEVIEARTRKLKGDWKVEITQGKSYDYTGIGLKPTLWERLGQWWRCRPPFIRPWF